MTDLLDLPQRSAKPRQQGITHVLDRGLSVAEVDGLVEVAGEFVDLVKLGWGTALATGNLEPKLERYRAHGIPVVLGGTLTELAIAQDRLDRFVAWLHELELEHIEISDGTITLPHDHKLELIERLSKEFVVLSEVGSKDDTQDHGAVPVGRADPGRARGRRVEGDRRGARERQRRDLPPRRRGADGADRRDRRTRSSRSRSCSRLRARTSRCGSCAASARTSTSATSRPRTCSRWRRSGSGCARTPPAEARSPAAG